MSSKIMEKDTTLQTRRCSSCETYIDGICQHTNELFNGRSFPPDGTCVHHSEGGEHITIAYGPNCVDRDRFTSCDVMEIKQMFRDGLSVKSIAEEFKVSMPRIRNHTTGVER